MKISKIALGGFKLEVQRLMAACLAPQIILPGCRLPISFETAESYLSGHHEL